MNSKQTVHNIEDSKAATQQHNEQAIIIIIYKHHLFILAIRLLNHMKVDGDDIKSFHQCYIDAKRLRYRKVSCCCSGCCSSALKSSAIRGRMLGSGPVMLIYRHIHHMVDWQLMNIQLIIITTLVILIQITTVEYSYIHALMYYFMMNSIRRIINTAVNVYNASTFTTSCRLCPIQSILFIITA